MRGYKNQSISFSDPLSLTLSRGERGLLQHPPEGEGVNGTAVKEHLKYLLLNEPEPPDSQHNQGRGNS